MILSVHILAGAAVATKTQNPLLGIFFALISHYLLDIPPHKEYSIENIKKRNWKNSYLDFLKVFLDIFSAFLIIFVIKGNSFMPYLGGLIAIIPDSMTLFYIIFSNNKLAKNHFYYHNKLNKIGEKIKSPLFWKIFSQAIVVILAIYFLL